MNKDGGAGSDTGTHTKFAQLSAGNFVRTRWWWVRHAPVHDDGGRIYGQSDPPCDTSNRAVFVRVAQTLPGDAVWVASHLRRTEQTATAIWEAGYGGGIPLRRLPALAEQDLGSWQGKDRAAFFASRKPLAGSFWFAAADERAPDGESFADLMARVRPAIDQLTQEYRGKDVIAVAHGGTIRAATAMALGLEPQRALGLAVENCSITRLDHYYGDAESGWRTVMVNHQPWLGMA
jgi:broad specificity phosphatase PhoE